MSISPKALCIDSARNVRARASSHTLFTDSARAIRMRFALGCALGIVRGYEQIATYLQQHRHWCDC